MTEQSPSTGSVTGRPGALLFAVLFLLTAVFLVSQLGEQTKFSSSGKLFAQPAFWPAVGVIGMLGFGLLHLLRELLRLRSTLPADRTNLADTFSEAVLWLRALEFLAWFMIYVWLTPQIGYLPVTVAFTTLLAFRVGYRKPATLAIAAAVGAAVVLVFKTFLSVKIPGAALYEYLPDSLRNFMIVNF